MDCFFLKGGKMANINNKMMINKVIKKKWKRVDFDGTKIAL